MLSSHKKSSLISRLWDRRCGDCSDEERQWQEAAEKSWKSMMKCRSSGDLRECLAALRRDDLEKHCWLVSRENAVVGSESISPEYLCCRMFRWPGLEMSDQLERLDHEDLGICKSREGTSDGLVCCSPFHFARTIRCEEEPLGDFHMDSSSRSDGYTTRQTVALPRSEDVDSAISVRSTGGCCSRTTDTEDFSSLTTDTGSADSGAGHLPRSRPKAQPSWMKIRYGEFKDRIGKQMEIPSTGVEVFYREADGAATAASETSARDVYTVNLHTIRNKYRAVSVRERQQKVGRGFLLWRKSYRSVHLYNRSQYSVYVQSPTLSHPGRPPRVQKIMPGRSMKIFDRARARQVEHWYVRTRGSVPRSVDLQWLRVSLTSSFGSDNPRHPTLFECHCWMEVYFSFPADGTA